MKSGLTLALLISGLGIANLGFAAPIVFEENHTNYAWTYDNRGCMIDENQNLYKYKLGDRVVEMPITFIEKVPAAEFTTAMQLAKTVFLSGETYVETQVGAEMGIALWTANVNGKVINLKQWGDWQGSLTSPESIALVAIIRNWCKPKDDGIKY